MSIFNDKALKSVAEAAAKIMGEQLKGNQHKIDANKNGKVDAHDFKLLRAGKKPDMKKEEVELDEAKTQSKDEKDKVVAAVTAAMRQSRANVMQGKNERSAARMNAKIKNNMKEDVEQLDEVGDTPAGRKALSSYVQKALHDKDRQKGLRKATSRLYKDNYYGKKTNEEVEQLQEYESKGGVFRHTAKLEKGAEYGASDYSKGGEEEKEAKKMTSSPKRASKGYGARQNFVRSTRVNEKKKVNEELSFTEMLELYNEHGLKVLAPIEVEEVDIDGTTIEVIDADKVNGVVATIVEEPTNDEFTKEYEDQKASFEGKKKQPKVAAGKTTGVKEMPESVQQIEERELTKGESKKKEEYVKGMKKGLSGFKQRYGERAKSVMYATATKMAKKD
jgi:hypothetical protein